MRLKWRFGGISVAFWRAFERFGDIGRAVAAFLLCRCHLCPMLMLNNISAEEQKIAIFWSRYHFFAVYLRRKEFPAEICPE